MAALYHGKPEARDKAVIYPQASLFFEPEDAKEGEGMTLRKNLVVYI